LKTSRFELSLYLTPNTRASFEEDHFAHELTGKAAQPLSHRYSVAGRAVATIRNRGIHLRGSRLPAGGRRGDLRRVIRGPSAILTKFDEFDCALNLLALVSFS
jgi:hypothetical protein